MILKRPSFRRGGNSGIGALRIKAANGFGGATSNPVNLFQTTPRTEISGGLRKGTAGSRLLTQLRNLAIPGATTAAGTLGIPVATAGGLAYLNKPRTLKEKEYMQSVGPLYETMSEDDLKAYSDETERLSKDGDEISFTDALFMDPKTGRYPKMFGRTSDRELIAKEAKEQLSPGPEGILFRGDPAQFTGEDEVTDFEALEALRNDKNKPEIDITEKSSISLDPKEEIRKEADFLKDLLKNESLTRGENALIIAEAIKEGGSLSDKISKAADLALPTVRRRDKQDKAITLKAYELFKRKEAEAIKAGKPTSEMRNIESIAKARKAQGDDRTLEEIKNEIIIEQSGADKNSVKIITAASAEIIGYQNDIDKQRRKLNTETSKKKPNAKTIEKINKKIAELQLELGKFASLDGFEKIFPGVKKSYLADGGRVDRANGSPMEGETMEVAETIADTPGAPTPEKQVLKLSYAELRNKLPKEITDDVVELLANSTEALQDFAYITTQDDVGNFNVKYGVNLVIPPATA